MQEMVLDPRLRQVQECWVLCRLWSKQGLGSVNRLSGEEEPCLPVLSCVLLPWHHVPAASPELWVSVLRLFLQNSAMCSIGDSVLAGIWGSIMQPRGGVRIHGSAIPGKEVGQTLPGAPAKGCLASQLHICCPVVYRMLTTAGVWCPGNVWSAAPAL